MFLLVFLATASLTHGRDTIWRESSASLKSTTYSLDIQHTPREWWDAAYNGCGEGWLYSPKTKAEQDNLTQQLSVGAKFWLGGVQSLRWIWTEDKSPFNTYRGFLPTTDVNITSATTLDENSAQACQYSCDTNNTCKGDCNYMFGLQGKNCYCLDVDADTQSGFNYRFDEKEMQCPGSIDDRCGNSKGMSIYVDYLHFPYPSTYDPYFLTSVSPQDECAYFSCSVQMMRVVYIQGTSNCTQRKAYSCGGSYNDNRLTWFEANKSCPLMKLNHGFLYLGLRDPHIYVCPIRGYREVWIGLKVEKKWKWLDGSDVEMNNIKEGKKTGRGCLAITRKSGYSEYEITRESCSLKLAYVCQKEITNQVASGKCNGTALMAAVAKQQTVSDVRSAPCSNGLSARSEALVLALCSAQGVANWKPKEKVMDSCSTLPLNIPVATFQQSNYVETEQNLAGIFLGCTNNGFMMAVQMCGQPPRIVFLMSRQSGIVTNADNYYVITYAPKSIIPIIG